MPQIKYVFLNGDNFFPSYQQQSLYDTNPNNALSKDKFPNFPYVCIKLDFPQNGSHLMTPVKMMCLIYNPYYNWEVSHPPKKTAKIPRVNSQLVTGSAYLRVGNHLFTGRQGSLPLREHLLQNLSHRSVHFLIVFFLGGGEGEGGKEIQKKRQNYYISPTPRFLK